MTIASTFLTVALSLLPFAFSQAKPDFSGSWKQVDLKVTPPPADTGGALPPGITVIRQTATTIAIEREAFGDPIVYTFALDGSESRNASGAMTMTTRTRWEGDRLVTEGTSVSVTSQGRLVWKTREVRYFDARKAHIVERTFTELRRGDHDVNARAAGARNACDSTDSSRRMSPCPPCLRCSSAGPLTTGSVRSMR